MTRVIAREPALFGVFIGAALTAGIQFGLPLTQAQANALTGVVVAGLAWWVRASVVSAETAVELATSAATKTAERLTDATAGGVGEVGAVATQVVDNVVGEVLGSVGGLVRVAGLREPEEH